MLPRTLEPEAMDSPEEARDYDQMDHTQVNRAFASDLCGAERGAGAWAKDSLQVGTVLDLGAGTAQIPIELCRQVPAARVLAVDLAPAMLALARRNVAAAGLTSRIALALADAKRLPLDTGRFSAVVSNSIVHHLAEPRGALAEAVRVCEPGGRLFFRDLLRPRDETTWQALVERYAGQASAHQRQLFAQSLLAALALEEIRELVASLGFPPDEVRATSDRHWTWSARRGD